MEKLHFHCQNCTRNEELFNITCIEEVKEHINSNLYTIISYNTCDNCKKLLKELKIDNYHNVKYSRMKKIYNLKLIEQYCFFQVLFSDRITLYRSYDTTKKWTPIDKKLMFDSIKDGTLIAIYSDCYPYNKSNIERKLERIKDKGYEVNFIQTIGESNYYIVKKPTLTKPAIKK